MISYIRSFIFNFHGFIKNRPNDQLPVGLLAQLVERCTGIAEVIGFESRTGLSFLFRLSFHNCKSCVYNELTVMIFVLSILSLCYYLLLFIFRSFFYFRGSRKMQMFLLHVYSFYVSVTMATAMDKRINHYDYHRVLQFMIRLSLNSLVALFFTLSVKNFNYRIKGHFLRN